MFVAALWFSCLLAYAYFHGDTLTSYPAVLVAPFIPSFAALTARTYRSLKVDQETFSRDAPRFLLDALHLICFPLGFILLFCKLWADQGDIPWWLVISLVSSGTAARAPRTSTLSATRTTTTWRLSRLSRPRVHTDVRRTVWTPWGPCRRRRLCSRRGAGEGAGLGAGGQGTRSGRSFERGLRVRTSSATWGDRAGGER
jgi:hypothetical protein